MGCALERLKELVATEQLHHATYRNRGTVWEGLWYYRISIGPGAFRGFELDGSVLKDDPDYEEAYRVLAGRGLHVGAYGGG